MQGTEKQVAWATKIQENIKKIVSDEFLNLVVEQSAKNALAKEGWGFDQIESVLEAKVFYEQAVIQARQARIEKMNWEQFKAQVRDLLLKQDKAAWWIEKFAKINPQNTGDLTKVYKIINP